MAQKVHHNVTRREAQILEVLHRHRAATVEQIREQLPNASSSSSVRKLLDIMIRRRLLTRKYDGPRWVYSPSAGPAQAARTAARNLVRIFFNNQVGPAAAALLETGGPISDEEYERLSNLLKKARR